LKFPKSGTELFREEENILKSLYKYIVSSQKVNLY